MVNKKSRLLAYDYGILAIVMRYLVCAPYLVLTRVPSGYQRGDTFLNVEKDWDSDA